jgi:hypothetical protein
LSYIFEVAKAEVDTQFRISERIDSKARGLFAITAIIFGAAQALSLRPDVLHRLGDEKDLVVGLAIGAGICTGLALIATAWLLGVRRDKSIESDPLFKWLGDLDEPKKAGDVPAEVVEAYITLMHRRQEQNVDRARDLIAVQFFCFLAILVSGVQLLVTLGGLT